MSVPVPFLVRERLDSLVPAPPSEPAKVVVVVWLTVSAEREPLPPTTEETPVPAVASPATVRSLLARLFPSTSLPALLLLSPRVRVVEAERRLSPPEST